MEAGTWIALAAVAVTLVSVLVTWRLGVRRFDHEREMTDRDALAVILDEAASEIHAVRYVLDDINIGLIERPHSYFLSPPGSDMLASLGATGRALDERSERLRIRSRADTTWIAFDALTQNALDLYRECIALRDFAEGEPPPHQNELRAFARAQRDEIAEHRRRFDHHREMFREAAFTAVGIELDGD